VETLTTITLASRDLVKRYGERVTLRCLPVRLGGPLLRLAALALAFGALSRLALRRFAA
jgi:hypothetical protein